jgi:rhodanese-related sulfurtransferase
MSRSIISEALLVTLIAVALALGAYALRPDILPLKGTSNTLPATQEQLQLYREISFEQAQALFEEGQALFADARPLIAFESGHIQGAVHMDPHALDQWADQLIAGYPSDQPIVTYCEGPRSTLSRELAEKLTWLGFEEVYYLVDGWGVWQDHQMPVSGVQQ